MGNSELLKGKAIAADKIHDDLDTIITASERAHTTAWLKTVAIYFSYDDLKIMREALNDAANRWHS